jgi:hypothetical protein
MAQNSISLDELIEQQEQRQHAAFVAALPLMETEAAGCGAVDTVAAVSLAISMKRIADFICGNPDRADIVAYLGRELDDWKKR